MTDKNPCNGKTPEFLLHETREKLKAVEQEGDAFKNQFEMVITEIERYKMAKGEEMKISYLVNQFRQATVGDTKPIINALTSMGVDVVSFKAR